jgi:hypothetical protein
MTFSFRWLPQRAYSSEKRQRGQARHRHPDVTTCLLDGVDERERWTATSRLRRTSAAMPPARSWLRMKDGR